MADTIHLSDEALLAALDGDAPEHLAACAECRERLGEIRAGIDEYHEFHHSSLKPSLSSAPHPWPELKLRRRPAQSTRWLAIAAAGIIAVIAIPQFTRHQPDLEPTLILQRAARVQRGAQQIKIRTGG